MSKRLFFSFISIISIILIFSLSSCANQNNAEKASGNDSLYVSRNLPWSVRLMESFRLRHPGAVTYDDVIPKNKWSYEQGLMLEAFKRVYEKTDDRKYYDFIKNNIDHFVDDKGDIRTYNYDDFNLDKISPGRALLFLYKTTNSKKYKIAADTLRKQLANQPRTKSGGFWHKKRYPNQMWLDGLFMAEPFYALYTKRFENGENYDDVVHQFVLIYNHTVDPNTSLLYHAWDESKEQKWSDPKTGKAPNVWGRAMGWYSMALVDVLDIIPQSYTKRDTLIKILRNVSSALLKYRDKKTGLWYNIIDKGNKAGNYIESSCSAMFIYSFAKGANEGYLDKSYFDVAKSSFENLINLDVTVEKNGFVDLHNTCSGAGLGGKPYRDGSFKYYMSVPKSTNDYKGYGPLIFAALELERH